VLIAFIIAHLTATGTTEIRIASNLVANAVVQATADGAIYEAIFKLSDPQPDQRWPVDGNTRELVVGSSRVLARLEDEAWWINPNLASPVTHRSAAARHRSEVARGQYHGRASPEARFTEAGLSAKARIARKVGPFLAVSSAARQ